MKKHSVAESGSFNLRIFLAFVLTSLGVLVGLVSFASTPSSGVLSDTTLLTYTAGPFTQSNPSPLGAGQLDTGPRCGGAQFPCDSYLLTINLPNGYTTGYPNAAVKVTASWTDTGTGQADYDLYVFKGDVATTSGSQRADYKSASGANPEIATIFPVVADGTAQKYTIKIVPYTASGETVNVKIQLFLGASGTPPPPGGPPFGGPDLTAIGAPRYINFYAPIGSSAEPSSGEFNIGFNPFTGRIMTMNSGPVWRLTPPERLAQAKPECCEALWEDRSFPLTDTGTDPILITDQKTGRTIAVNNLSSPLGNYAYTNDDGDTWNPIGGGPPNGADHETIGTGPLPASLSLFTTPLNQGQYLIFCSQTLVGANCERSYDLGTTYFPPMVATGPGAANSQGCGGLHGHVHIAPDGTAYLPDNSCGVKQGGALTLDASTTPWTEFVVEKTVADAEGPAFTAAKQANGADPSIGIDKGNTLYYCYVNNEKTGTEGHAHVAVGKRVGSAINWIRDTDIGATHGIVNAAHTEAIAGDAGRAACGFFGTNVNGDYQKGDFPGAWYTFIATTYDEGRTWTTVNATPNDPVQSMTGIWQQGGGGDMGDRNLLDFNEVTMDDKGRVLYGYSDGCTSADCVGGTARSNLGAAMRVARQMGGKTLLAAYDGNTDTTTAILPKAACLTGTRDTSGSHLTWRTPDNGGSDITSYDIYRSTSSGSEAKIATYYVGSGSKAAYTDATANPAVSDYYYKIVANNSVGAGLLSNEVDLKVVQQVVESACTSPGLTKLTDSTGDSIGGPGTDLLSFHLAQPYVTDGNIRLVFTINVDPSLGAVAAGSFDYVTTKIPGPDPAVSGDASTQHYRGVRVNFTNPAAPTFEFYTPSGNSSGGVDGRFVKAGSNHPAESGNYNAGTGTITITVKASDLTLAEGTTVGGFISGAAQPANPTGTGANAVALYDQMPDSLAYTGNYTVANNQACAPNTVPTAALSGTPTSGIAPLNVSCDGSRSSDPDAGDSIASYTFDFGDGSTPVTQTSATVSHSYGTAGSYRATLTVKDSRGASSTNNASVAISVAAPKPDLTVTSLVASNNKAPQGTKVTLTAIIKNEGQATAAASKTQFKYDANTQIGALVDTPSLAPGQTATVKMDWYTAGVPKGSHAVTATADQPNTVLESTETNNSNQITISIQGNKT